jgi:hypothetical protein
MCSTMDNFVNSIASLPWFNLKLNRGVFDFNVGRTLVISGTGRYRTESLFRDRQHGSQMVGRWERFIRRTMERRLQLHSVPTGTHRV